MTKINFQTISLVSIGLLLGVLLTNGIVTAQFNSRSDSPDDMHLANHHREMNFNLAPGGSHSFSLPRKDCPVRIEVSTSTIDVIATNGSTSSRPVLLTTTVSLDSQSGRVAGFGVNDHNNEGICPSGPDFGCAFVAIEIASNGTVTIRQSTTGGAQITNPRTTICASLWF